MASLSGLTQLKLLLLIALYSTIADIQYFASIGQISQNAHALLYHQITLPPAEPTVLSRVSRHYQTSNISSEYYLSNNNNNQYNRQAPVSSRQQQQQLAAQTSYLTSNGGGVADLAVTIGEDECPLECHCNKVAQIADCSDRNLTRVPNGFPKDIKRIRLERNSITEIGPFAFQGLKRLQRIDLSNNNLQNIDPLAFSGGLQALNSLILYSNKLEQLPVNVFSELNQLQLLLLNANSLQSISRELFQSLANLTLLSLYDNNIATLASGTFDGLKNIKTIHLGKNPLQCDCNLAWLADYLRLNPVETSEARCETPSRAQARKLSLMDKKEFKCLDPSPSRVAPAQLAPTNQQQPLVVDPSCPAGCVCKGITIDCSKSSQSESKLAGPNAYELPDIPDDVPVYVARVHINDSRIKRIRQTGLFKRLANSQKLDLGDNRIVDVEDNAIGAQLAAGTKPERVVFILIENQFCGLPGAGAARPRAHEPQEAQARRGPAEDPCSAAPRVNEPQFDSPCYNGGQCRPGAGPAAGPGASPAARYLAAYNYSCACAPGFAGPLCELNPDDCQEHQCQNGARCVDGVNGYRCECRDPTTSGEFCEQLAAAAGPALAPFGYATSSASSIAPLALPIIASAASSMQGAARALAPQSAGGGEAGELQAQPRPQQAQPQPISVRSVDFSAPPPPPPPPQQQLVLGQDAQANAVGDSSEPQPEPEPEPEPEPGSAHCRRTTQRSYVNDGNGCQSVRLLKLSQCVGGCAAPWGPESGRGAACCRPARVKRRRIRMQCSDGASYMRTVELVKRCACQPAPPDSCPRPAAPTWPPKSGPRTKVGASHQYQVFELKQAAAAAFGSPEDQSAQITRLDAQD